MKMINKIKKENSQENTKYLREKTNVGFKPNIKSPQPS